MMKKLILILMLLAPISLIAEDLTLEQAIKIGLENNYAIQISKQETEIAKINNTWGTVGRLPMIDLGVSNANRYDENQQVVQGFEIDTKQNSYAIAPFVQLNWTIFDGFSIGIRKDNMEKLEKLSKGNEQDIVEAKVQDIVMAYYGALLDKQRLEVLGEIKKLSLDRYTVSMMKKDLGNAVTFDVLQFKNAYLRDSTNYLLQEVSYQNSLRSLNYLLAAEASVEYNPSDEFNYEFETYSLDNLKQSMLKNNKIYQNMLTGQEILENNIDLENNEYMPKLKFNSGADYSKNYIYPQGDDSYDTYRIDYYANLSLSINIYNGGNTERAVQVARIEEEKGRMTISQLKLSLENRLQNLHEQYELKKQLYSVSVSNRETSQLNLQISKDKFDSGAINSFNYRDIQLQYISASLNELGSVYDLLQTRVDILKLTGLIMDVY
jgi:outer membrane protein